MLDRRHRPFFIFGAGHRPKFIYADGALRRWSAGDLVESFAAAEVHLDAAAYAVTLADRRGRVTRIVEDEAGIRLEAPAGGRCLTDTPVRLPDFAGHRHRDRLRILHHEILVNVGGRPAAAELPRL